MTEVARPFYRACLTLAIAAVTLTAGCSKKPVATRAPETTPPPAARPTVTLTASPTTINKGESATLNWSSTNATQLTISPEVGAVAPEGSTKVSPSDSTTYAITASGPGGSADSSIRITVNAPPPPAQPAPT